MNKIVDVIFNAIPGEIVKTAARRKYLRCLNCGFIRRSYKAYATCTACEHKSVPCTAKIFTVAQAFYLAGFDIQEATSFWYADKLDDDKRDRTYRGVYIGIKFGTRYPVEIFNELKDYGFYIAENQLSSREDIFDMMVEMGKNKNDFWNHLEDKEPKEIENILIKFLHDWIADKDLEAMLAVAIFQGVAT
jgi:hypothetical protein